MSRHRHPGFDNCKGVFIFYVVLWHMLNGWDLDQAIQNWPPWIGALFKAYSLWHEKFSVPGFAFVSGFFGKGLIQGPDTAPRKWEGTISVLLIGTIQYQVLCEFSGALVQGLYNNEWHAPTNLLNWDHLCTWYLFALLVWRITTPVIMLFRRPLLVSLLFALVHIHCAYGWPYEFRARVFHFFPYYVAGLVCDTSTLNSITTRPRLVGGIGIFTTLLITYLLPGSFLGHIYYEDSWSFERHFIFAFQYLLCGSIVLSIVLFVKEISTPLFPWSHSSNTLAIYAYHWQILSVMVGKIPFSDVYWFGQDRTPREKITDYFSPILAILILHFLSYVSCVALGSKQFWSFVRPISNPDCSWLFRHRELEKEKVESSSNDTVLPLVNH